MSTTYKDISPTYTLDRNRYAVPDCTRTMTVSCGATSRSCDFRLEDAVGRMRSALGTLWDETMHLLETSNVLYLATTKSTLDKAIAAANATCIASSSSCSPHCVAARIRSSAKKITTHSHQSACSATSRTLTQVVCTTNG